MTAKNAIKIARRIRSGHRYTPAETHEAILALLDHGDAVAIPDMETSIRMVAAHIHTEGRFYIEIAVDPKTKEVGWTFDPTERDDSHNN